MVKCPAGRLEDDVSAGALRQATFSREAMREPSNGLRREPSLGVDELG
jgi:hypothetical protein